MVENIIPGEKIEKVPFWKIWLSVAWALGVIAMAIFLCFNFFGNIVY